MAVKLRAASGVEIYLNPSQIVILLPHPQLIGQTVAMGAGVTESFSMSMDELAEKLWPETKSAKPILFR